MRSRPVSLRRYHLRTNKCCDSVSVIATRLFTSRQRSSNEEDHLPKTSARYFLPPDSNAEKKLRMLTDSGLQQVSDVHFKLSPDASKKDNYRMDRHLSGNAQQSLPADRKYGEYSLLSGRNPIEQSCDDEPDWFELHITVVIIERCIPFLTLPQAYPRRKREYLLPDGRMILLPEEWFSKYGNLLELGTQTETGIRLKPTFLSVPYNRL